METITMNVNGMTCGGCVASVTRVLKAVPGVTDVAVTLTDFTGILPTQTLDVLRRGIFGGSLSDPLGSPEFTFFIGADFSIGTPSP